MKFLHFDFSATTAQTIKVELDKQANVLLLDDSNFRIYQRGGRYRYDGGWATESPVHLRPRHTGNWHVVIDLAGRAGTVHASAELLGVA